MTSAGAGPFDIARDAASIPRPRMADVRPLIGDLLPQFSVEMLRASYKGGTASFILGARNRARFPASNRFARGPLEAWIRSFTCQVRPEEIFDILSDSSLDPLQPYTVFGVSQFGDPFRSWTEALNRRLQLPASDGFTTLWMSRGGYVSALHEDGFRVHGRWNLALAGEKHWDFLPPRFRGVERLPMWDLNRRYSALYRDPIPTEWRDEEGGASHVDLVPGQMVTWGRRWWHRVEVAPTGLTASISTLAHRRAERLHPGSFPEALQSLVFGETRRDVGRSCPMVTIGELRSWAEAERAAPLTSPGKLPEP